ncbi:MAG: hypothetical protein ACRCYS_12375 [Beijerinckiaceae bacterium]
MTKRYLQIEFSDEEYELLALVKDLSRRPIATVGRALLLLLDDARRVVKEAESEAKPQC